MPGESPEAPGSSTSDNDRALTTRELEPFVGTYFLEQEKLVRRVEVKDDKLFYIRGAAGETELTPLGSDRFRGQGTETLFRFEKTGDRVTAVCIERPEETICALWKQPPTQARSALASFSGSYESNELGEVTYEVAVQGGDLVVTTPDDTLVFQQAFTDFFSDIRMGFLGLEWQRDDQGRPSGFLVHAGRVRDIQFRRVETNGE